jgi:hypothetical protein
VHVASKVSPSARWKLPNDWSWRGIIESNIARSRSVKSSKTHRHFLVGIATIGAGANILVGSMSAGMQ